ncbi:sensor histidine kinase [Micromonospora peucetia]|nr:sensor histidine kinase [Micromonospora peucetia]
MVLGLPRWRLQDRRIRTKLALLLALPLMATVALSGVLAAGAASAASQAEQSRQLVVLGGTAGRLAAHLQGERTAAALVLVRGSNAVAAEGYRRQTALTDGAVTQFDEARRSVRAPLVLQGPLRRVEEQLANLGPLRQQVQAGPDATSSLVVFRYRAVVADLLAYRQGLSQVGVDAQTGNDLRAAASLSQAVESLGLMQVAVVRSLGSGRLTPAGQQEIVGADVGFTEAMQAFRALAPARWQARVNAQLSGRNVLEAERLLGVVARATQGSALRLGVSASRWATAVGARMGLLHAAEQELDAELLAAVTQRRDEQRRTIVLLSVTVVACLAVMVAVGWWVTRSMTGSLQRLRAGAHSVAADRLPRMVAQLGGDHPDQATIDELMAQAAEPIAVDGRDEVGQVADAFNRVSLAAVRIAGEQAALRATVAGIFLSLSRRLQSRADRMMVNLDALERDEEDPDRLEKLFDLDHVATLIRRMTANLQVLAGGRAGRPTPEPVALPDLLRAAGSEIDDYKRVELGIIDGAVLVGRDVAEELMHLLAELIDNATKYSAPDTPVMVEGSRVGDLLHLQVRDYGIGMREAELQAALDRLAHPHRMDRATTQQMGLPVVGRIANRLGITVQIRSDFGEGTRVDVTLALHQFTVAQTDWPATPPRALADERTRELPAVVARPGPRAEGPPPAAWPPAVRALPATPAPASTPVGPPPPLAIFDAVRSDPRHSWFTSAPGDGAAQGGPAMPARWKAAADAALAAATDPATETTSHGLPVRRPGRRVIPPVAPGAQAPVPAQRDPEALRRQMSAIDSALGAAGRRTHHTLKESPR